MTEAEEFNTQEPDRPVEEVDEFDFQDEEFKRLIEEYAQNYEGDDDEDSVSVNDDGKKLLSILFQKKKLKLTLVDDIVEPMKIDNETKVYNVEVRKNKFNKLEKVSLRLMKICTEGGVSRACQRKIHSLFNETLQDVKSLRK